MGFTQEFLRSGLTTSNNKTFYSNFALITANSNVLFLYYMFKIGKWSRPKRKKRLKNEIYLADSLLNDLALLSRKLKRPVAYAV